MFSPRSPHHQRPHASSHQSPGESGDPRLAEGGGAPPLTAAGRGREPGAILAALLAGIEDFVGLAAFDGQVLYLNPAGRRLLGLAADADLALASMTDFIVPEQRDAYLAKALPALLARGAWAGEIWLRHGPSGESLPVHHQVFTVPAREDHQPALMAVVNRDLRERIGLARALGQAEESLERSAQAAHMGEVAASIVHEINQPLAAIVAHAQACLHWLEREPPDLAQARVALRGIAADGLRGGQIVERMRSLVRDAAPHEAELDLNEVVRQTLQVAHQRLHEPGFALSLVLQADLPAAQGDAMQLQQVLLNLMHNAQDAMRAAGLGEHRLTISTRRGEAGDVVAEVQDTGRGMPPDVVARLFQPYQSRKPTGMGMGLLISRRIVESHGGRLWVLRSDQRGTVVSFSLPARAAVSR